MPVTPNAGIKPIEIALKVNMDEANQQALKAANETTQAVVGAYSRLGALKIGALGGLISAAGGAAAALMFGVGAASRFEDSFAGIKKTVDASENDFNRLAVSIRQLSTEIPIATSQLNQIGELGGQLGIEASGLPVFIETIAKLGVATRLSTETAALSLARLKEIFQLQEFEIANLGSALVDLGNNFAALEDEILSTSLRLAAGAKVAGATVADTLAIATALQAVGVQSQAGGTAMSRVFQQLTVAVQGNQRAMDVFVQTSGLTQEAFTNIAKEDPAQALNLFIQGLNRVADSGGNVVAILDELGLKQQRTIRALLSVAEAGDLLTDALARSNVAYEINNALNEEAEKRFETLRSKNKLLKNAFQELRTEIGLNFLPFVKGTVEALTEVINGMGNTEKSMNEVSRATVAIVSTFTILGTAMSAMAGQFFLVRTLASQAGLSLGELSRLAVESAGAFGVNNIVIEDTTRRYLKMTAAIKTSMGALLPAMSVLSVGMMINAASNAKAERTASLYSQSVARLIPLQAELNEKTAEYENLLADPNIKVEALDTVKRELEIISEELEALEVQVLQTFINLPKFRPDFNVEETMQARKAFEDLFEGLLKRRTEFGTGEEVAKLLEDALNVDADTIQGLIDNSDLKTFTDLIYRAMLTDDQAGVEIGELLLDPIINSLAAYKQLDTSGMSIAEKIDVNYAVSQLEILNTLFTNIANIDGKEVEFLSKEVSGTYEKYLQMAESSDKIEIFSYESFVKNPEAAAYVFDVLAGKIDVAETEAEKFGGRVDDIVGKITEAVAESENLSAIFEGIGDITIPSPTDLLNNIQEYQNAQKFLQIAVTEFADRGMLAIATQVGEGGVNAENLGRTIALLSNDLPLEDLQFYNDTLISSEEKYSDLAEGNLETLNEVESRLRTQYGLSEGILSTEEKRAVINQIISSSAIKDEDTSKDILSVVKEILDISRERVDVAEELADAQAKIDDFNKDLVYDNITITSEMREQMEIDEATLALKEAIAQYGNDEVVTNKEQIAILQATLNIDRMREKLSKQRTARERKSIRDKQKEIKFLELAVEQGVAEQLDLDAAREELSDLTKPMAQAEKNLLELQLKVAEAEKAILEERSKNLAPELVDAIKNYNEALDISEQRADELAQMESDLARATEDANIQALEQSQRLEEIKKQYPDIESILVNMSDLIGVPAGILQETLNSYNESYEGFKSTAAKIAAVTGFVPSVGDVDTEDDGSQAGDTTTGPGSYEYNRFQNGLPIHAAPYVPEEYGDPAKSGPINPATKTKVETETEKKTPWWQKAAQFIVDPSSRNFPTMSLPSPKNNLGITGFGAYPGQTAPSIPKYQSNDPSYIGLTDLAKEYILNPIGKAASSVDWNRVVDIQNTWMGKAYGGSVPIGQSSVVGEMGPELIMSTPGGTSVFSNKTGGGYGGITVENMNVNITGLPADPISARKAAINIRKELTKLEKEGNAGTGLRNR